MNSKTCNNNWFQHCSILFAVLLALVAYPAKAQLFDELSEVSEFQNGLKFGIGGLNVGFPRSPWVNTQNLLNNDGYGLVLNTQLNVQPFLLDLSYGGATFRSQHLKVPVPADSSALYTSFNAMLGLHLLPNCRYFNPYIGGGWQADRLKTHVPDGSSNYGHINQTSSTAFWRFGLLLHFSERYSVHCFYQKTLPEAVKVSPGQQVPNALQFPDRPYSVQMLGASILFNFFKSND